MNRFLPRFLSGFLVVAVFIFYWQNLAPGLIWDDPPEMGSLLASVKSPLFFILSPSPLYLLLAQAWKNLPFGELALRGNTFSAVLATFSVFLVFLIALRLSGDLKSAIFGGVVFSFLPLSYSFALQANFYILLLAVSLTFFYLILSRGDPAWAALLLGLAIAVFPAGVVLLLPFLLYLWYSREDLSTGVIGRALIWFLIGLAPLAIAKVFFGVPIFRLFASLGPLSNPISSIERNMLSLIELVTEGIPWPIFSLVLIGLLWGHEGKNRTLLVTGFLSFLLLLGIYSLPERRGLYLFPISVLAVWAALGVNVVWTIVAVLSNTEIGAAFENQFFVLVFRLKRRVSLLRHFFLGALLLFLCFLTFKEFSTTVESFNPKRLAGADTYGSIALASLPTNSLVLAQEGKFLSTLRYFASLSENQRVIVTSTSFALDPLEYARLATFYPGLYLPPFVGENASYARALGALDALVDKNLDNFSIFFTLSNPSQDEAKIYGRWRGYRLVSKKPLYQLIR